MNTIRKLSKRDPVSSLRRCDSREALSAHPIESPTSDPRVGSFSDEFAGGFRFNPTRRGAVTDRNPASPGTVGIASRPTVIENGEARQPLFGTSSISGSDPSCDSCTKLSDVNIKSPDSIPWKSCEID